MKTTKFVLSFLILFAVAILFAGIASAGTLSIDTDSIVVPQSVAHDAGSFDITFDLINTGTEETLDWAGSAITQLNGDIDFNTPSIGADQTVTVTATVTFDAFQQGTMEGLIKVTGSENSDEFIFETEIPESKALEINSFEAPTSLSDGFLKLKNIGNVALSTIEFATSGNIQITFNPEEIASLDKNTISDTISLTIANLADLKFGFNPTTITARAADGTQVTSEQFTIQKTFCSDGTVGDLEITDFNVNNLDGSDDTWEIFEEIEIDVEIKNTGSEDIDDIELELAFYDSDGVDYADDFDWKSSDDENPDLGKIRDGKDETHTFRFVVPEEFAELGDASYMLAVKAYSTDEGEDTQCVDSGNDLSDDFFESIEIELPTEDDEEVVVTDIVFNQDPAVCGEVVSGEFSVYNLGDEEQERILVHMKNTPLGLDQEFEITKDLDVGKGTDIQFSFQIPQDADDDFYDIRFTTEYDYDDGEYDTESAQTFIGSFRAICDSSSSNGGNALITATLDSDVVAGGDITVTATITNTGSDEATFIVEALGFNSWASLDSLQPNILTLASGESRDVNIVLTADEDASGSQSFTIQTSSQGNLDQREVEVSFSESSGGITGFSVAGLGGSGFVWLLVLINVILIILIIVVAVRIARN